MGFFDAWVDHLDEDFVELVERDHQLLLFLHLAEAVLCQQQRVMEKHIVLARELNLYVFDLGLAMSPLNSIYGMINLLIWGLWLESLKAGRLQPCLCGTDRKFSFRLAPLCRTVIRKLLSAQARAPCKVLGLPLQSVWNRSCSEQTLQVCLDAWRSWLVALSSPPLKRN